jgi:putative sigma-54 modulation protein
MKIQIHAPWEVNAYTEGVIRKKTEKLSTFYERIEKANVYLKDKEGDTVFDKCVEIRLAIPGADLFAESHADCLEKAAADAAEKLRRQLLKQKDKWMAH